MPDSSTPNRSDDDGSTQIAERLNRDTRILTGTKREVIFLDTNKVKLILLQKYGEFKAQREWMTPVGIFLTILLALLTTKFQKTFGIDAYTWQAIFLICAVICFGWSIITIYKAVKYAGSNTVDSIMADLLKESEELPNDQQRPS